MLKVYIVSHLWHVSKVSQKHEIEREMQKTCSVSMNFLFQGSDGGPSVATLQAALSEKEAEILRLTEQLKASTVKQEDTVTQVSVLSLTRVKQELFKIRYPPMVAFERWL